MQNAPSRGTVAELGEHEVLSLILRQYEAADRAVIGPGDDCAVLRLHGDTVVTSDSMIEGPDFRLAWHSGYDLGWKLAATNLSDVAAMGARPIALTVALACPAGTPVELLEEIARGLSEASRTLAPGCGVVGGDLGRSSVVTAAITALGDLESRPPVVRSGAGPGDIVAYAGQLGLAGMGLSLLFTGSAHADGTAHSDGLSRLREQHPALLAAQLAPSPPIMSGIAAAEAAATAMLDVSDGLAIDAARIARASGVHIDLSSELLKRSFGDQRGEQVTIDAMLYGGEDHGLLATFPQGTDLPEGFLQVGTVRETEQSPGEHPGQELLLDGVQCEIRGWDPFTVRPPGS